MRRRTARTAVYALLGLALVVATGCATTKGAKGAEAGEMEAPAKGLTSAYALESSMLNVAVVTHETMNLSTGPVEANMLEIRLRDDLSAAVKKVVRPRDKVAYDAPAADIVIFGGEQGADAVVLAKATTVEAHNWQGYIVHEANADLKVISVIDGSEIGEQRFQQRGERDLDEKEAALSALSKIREPLAQFAVDTMDLFSPVVLVGKLEVTRVTQGVYAYDIESALAKAACVRTISVQEYDQKANKAVYRIEVYRHAEQDLDGALRKVGLRPTGPIVGGISAERH